jgi:hypothetical protein
MLLITNRNRMIRSYPRFFKTLTRINKKKSVNDLRMLKDSNLKLWKIRMKKMKTNLYFKKSN